MITIPRRRETLHTFTSQGGMIAAVLPIHYPRALLRAFNTLPVEVWGPPRVEIRFGAAHLQPYLCPIVHNALSFLQTGGLDIASLLLVPHACDSLQGLGSILLDFVSPRQPVLPFYLPRGRRESDLDFLAQEFASLYHHLERITGQSPTEVELLQSIYREESADALLASIYQGRTSFSLSNLDFYRLVRSREYLPAERFIALAQELLSTRGTFSAHSEQRTIKLVLSGIVPEPMSMLTSLSQMGGVVVADDLACCGRRHYPAGKSQEPFRRMAERIIQAPPDPSRGSPIQERLDHLLQLIQRTGAKGMIFHAIKFCEPELFDLPYLRQGMQDAGVPTLTVEGDLAESQQLLTRLEAFMEMIQ